ncbi:imidazoleglycerol-phosphate dehydratase HisB [bacterium]|nr:imidazoleglycerol-phosphate dehydratase HisB [bacterium]MBU1152887.1 imidazoleglycerol-phosphate dehydratase HisB [bacterium]
MSRKSKVERITNETQILVSLDLDGEGKHEVNTKVPFLDHMLSLLAKHGLFNLEIKATGDLEVDNHHLVEDVGLTLGEAINKALGNKAGIKRFAFASVPMDESLVALALDISGRPLLVYNVRCLQERTGNFESVLTEEFFKAVTNSAKITFHINLLYGNNTHHIIEAIFKAFGQVLSMATTIDKRIKGIPSTKGRL